MNYLLIILYVLFLFIVFFVAGHNLLYTNRIERAKLQLGLSLPRFIKGLLFANIALAAFAAIFIITFLVFSFKLL